MSITAAEMGRRGAKSRWGKASAEEKTEAARKAVRAYWDRLTPEERSAEMKRRAAKREKAKKRTKR